MAPITYGSTGRLLVACLAFAVATLPCWANFGKDAVPNIFLVDKLDEVNGFGFCLDIFGRGGGRVDCDQVLAHTCITDPQFEYNHSGNVIHAINYKGDCSIVSSLSERACLTAGSLTAGAKMRLDACSGEATQQFAYNERKEFVVGNSKFCLAASASSSINSFGGQHSHRDLSLQDCATTDAVLKSWVVINACGDELLLGKANECNKTAMPTISGSSESSWRLCFVLVFAMLFLL
eukprot:TRINITY_DN60386_c0_g1_i1.p1 TRINITY_DN60386_c0_g1~~TRINITY_DN60386_c0_g1_i1.p1  ORF type:complete len:248 (-),score=22.68 TRINITY_DN60386_c0_g1_i1:64-768(-)